uniref:Desmoplakin n=1 Tax=Spodoptera frugiperda granulovirus TaxID=307454 RepID=A0A346QW34_9BBAC|nr:desmoplakin [Spodoptera frugiperda granulovirus]
MLTRYKGVDVNPQTFHNLIRTIASKQSSTVNDSQQNVRSIISSFRPDLSKLPLSTEQLLIMALKDINKKEVTYNYNYTQNKMDEEQQQEEQHIVNPSSPDIFIRIWRLGNIDREEACVLAGAVRDLCNAVLKHAHPDYDPDRDASAATLLRLCTETRYTKRYAYEETQAMDREVNELEKELLESRSKVAELLASFSNFKTEWEKKLNMAQETIHRSENEVARLELMLLDKNDAVTILQQRNTQLQVMIEELEAKLEQANANYNKCCATLEERDTAARDYMSKISYLETQLQQIADTKDSSLVLLEKEYAEKDRMNAQKHALQIQEKEAQTALLEQRFAQQSALADEYRQQAKRAEDKSQMLQAQLLDAQQKINTLQHSNRYLQSNNQHDLDALEAKLNAYTTENTSLRQQIERLKSLNAQDADSNAELQALNKKLKRDYDNALLRVDEYKREIDKINKEHDESCDAADRSYNLQKGEINRLSAQLSDSTKRVKSLEDQLQKAHERIAEQAKTISHCNYEIETLAAVKTKQPVKHKLSPHNDAMKQKIAKKGLIWDVNKLYGVKTQEQLNQLIEQIAKKNESNKDWVVYKKFLSCPTTELDQLKDNPEYQSLDNNFKQLLYKQRELLSEEEGSLFNKK